MGQPGAGRDWAVERAPGMLLLSYHRPIRCRLARVPVTCMGDGRTRHGTGNSEVGSRKRGGPPGDLVPPPRRAAGLHVARPALWPAF